MASIKRKERLFKLGAAISFAPFIPLLWHAWSMAFLDKSNDPHLGLIVFSLLVAANYALRLPYLFSANKLVFNQLISVFALNILLFTLYMIAIST
tara:strand:- start:488 stop:772 length:285 start_codon:yes stop_codon:yes gene_type:complete